MRVAIVTNAIDWATRGNHTTIWRWLAHVKGVEIDVVASDCEELDPVPDIVHGYHARNGGLAAMALARRYQRPLVVCLGGTDLLALVERTPGWGEVEEVLRAADIVTGAFDSFGEMLDKDIRYATVRRGVQIPERVERPPPDGRLRVLLPAGLRPVKNPLLAIGMAAEMVARGLPLGLRILGPVLDDAYARRVVERADELDFVSLGEVAPQEMPAAYAQADVVWNTSRFEGGANALLEAVAHGCACFARNVPGNRDFLDASQLFEAGDVEAVERFHRALLEETDEERRIRIERGHAKLRADHDPDDEARALERVWSRVGSAS